MLILQAIRQAINEFKWQRVFLNTNVNAAFKNYRNNSSSIDLKCRFKYLQPCLNASIEIAQERYYHNTLNKLMNTQKNYKLY